MPDPLSDAAMPRPTVLVVDDNVDFSGTLVTLLEMEGYAAYAKPSARDAADALDDDTSIRIVVMDVRMPSVDGFDFTRVLRHRFPKLPVVLMTGSTLTEEDAPPRGIAILEKPFPISELVGVIRTLIPDSPAKPA